MISGFFSRRNVMGEIIDIQKAVHFLSHDEIRNIGRYIEERKVVVIKEETGMIMMNANDSFGNPFYVGEILVTETEIVYGNSKGYGLVTDDNKEKSLMIAFADALSGMSDNAAYIEYRSFFENAITKMKISEQTERSLADATRVNFGLMTEG
jgi:phosphonate C-P lyase system protein PhnG